MKILLGMPCGTGQVPSDTVRWLWQLKLPKGIELGFTIIDTTHVLDARNRLIDTAIENGMDLLFVDDDNPPPTDLIERMIRHDKDIVTGIVPSRKPDGEGRHRLSIFKGFSLNDRGELHYEQYMDMPEEKELFEVGNAGFGCIYIRNKVLKDVKEKHPMPCEMKMVKYFDIDGKYVSDEEIDPRELTEGMLWYGLYVSEDLIFLDRAKRLGYKVYCDPTIQCKHIGEPQIITIESHILPNSVKSSGI